MLVRVICSDRDKFVEYNCFATKVILMNRPLFGLLMVVDDEYAEFETLFIKVKDEEEIQ